YFTIAAGLALRLPTTTTGGVGWYIASTAIPGAGYRLSCALVADTGGGAVPAKPAGARGRSAAPPNDIGNALGIALLGSVAALAFRVLGPELAPTLNETLDLATTGTVVTAAKSAFLTGLHIAMATGAVLCAGMGVLTLRWIPKERFHPDRVRP